MPAKKNTNDSTPSLDELLNFGDENKSQPADVNEIKAGTVETSHVDSSSFGDSIDISANGTSRTESFESTELAALREELAKAKEELAKAHTNPTDDAGRPLPESALSPEQREIRQLQDELARSKGRSLSTLTTEEFEEIHGDGILIHVLEDGLTGPSRVFYRGEEILFGPKAYEDTKDRNGLSWLDMTEEEQYERWGTLKFRRGPWPGKRQFEEDAVASKSIRTVAPLTKY